VREPPYVFERIGVVMESDADDPHEAWGVLNPGAARGRDGELYLFPRLVAEGNFSRIGYARVRFDDDRPTDVQRLGVALEPAEAWERNALTGGGVEVPRVTFVEELDVYVLAYSAFGPLGPRIGLAASLDLKAWERLGPAWFAYDPALGTDLNLYSNKDAALFPELVTAPSGEPSYALLHRPTWDLSAFGRDEGAPLPEGLEDPRPGIWVSFAPARGVRDLRQLVRFEQHRLLALPQQPWEASKIGAGTPPVPVPEGWLFLYHGVSAELVYSAAAIILDSEDVTRVVARSADPLLEPATREELDGTVGNVVFPTAIDLRPDGGADAYYGMADTRIGVARLSRRQ
jgi:predicted GH43/DUF377 family glycosyl hydrolase